MGELDNVEDRRFPNVEKVLIDYMREKLLAHEPWFISPELNDQTVTIEDIQALGFWTAILTTIAKVATTVGSAVVKAAPAVAQIAGTSAQIRAANAQMQNTGTVIPNQIATQVAAAAKQDILGTGMSTGTLLMMGGGLLLLVLLTR